MKQALLAVSFGTSVPRARQDIEAVERVLAAGAPERAFCRAYTSPTIRRILAERGEPVPGLPEALEALAAAGVEDAAVQPTHLLYGFEYDKLKADAAAFAGRFARLALGRPLAADSESARWLLAWRGASGSRRAGHWCCWAMARSTSPTWSIPPCRRPCALRAGGAPIWARWRAGPALTRCWRS